MSLIQKQDEERAQVLSKQIQQAIREDRTTAISRHLAELIIAMEDAQRTLLVHEHSLRMLQLPIVRNLASTAQAHSVIDIDAQWDLRGSDGFHGLEYTEDRTPFRWTGPLPRFQFVLHVDRSTARRGELFFLPSESPAIVATLESLAVSVDGNTVESQLEHANRTLKVSFDIPPRSGTAATTLVCDQALWSPADHGSDDTRQLGAQFRRLRIVETQGEE